MQARRLFTVEFKQKVIEEIKSGILSKAQAMRQYELAETTLYRWIEQHDRGKLNNTPSHKGALENRIAELERLAGRQALEIELLKKARERYQSKINEKSFSPWKREGLPKDVV